MPTPTLTTSNVITHVHEVSTRIPDYLDYLTILLPAVLPVLTFLAGYSLNSWYEKRKERARLEEVKDYFLSLATFLANVVDSQSIVIQDGITKIERMAEIDLTVPTQPELNTTRIKAIPDIDLYKVLIAKKNKIEANTGRLNALSSSLDFIDNAKESIEQTNSGLSREISLYSNRFNDRIATLSNQCNKLIIISRDYTVAKDDESYALRKIYDECVKAYAEKFQSDNILPSDWTTRYEVFIKPIYEKTREIKMNTNTNSVLMEIDLLRQDYEHFLVVKNAFIKQLSDLALNCKNVSAEINLTCEYFRK
jgi:hypothetical protein